MNEGYNVQHPDFNLSVSQIQASIEERVLHKIETAPNGGTLIGEPAFLVTSTFCTIQGEGPHAGRPAFFIRMAGCNFGAKNVACQFCDTDFAIAKSNLRLLNKGLLSEGPTKISLLEEVRNATSKYGIDLVVITGGEPFLQPDLYELVKALVTRGYDVQIETNGRIAPSWLVTLPKEKDFIFNQFLRIVVSPKVVKGIYTQPHERFKESTIQVDLKFLISADVDSPYYSIPEWTKEWRELVKKYLLQIYVSPIAVYAREYQGEISDAWEPGLLDIQRTRANYSRAGQYALENACRLSIQQHLFAKLP